MDPRKQAHDFFSRYAPAYTISLSHRAGMAARTFRARADIGGICSPSREGSFGLLWLTW